jgi:hypothetical protein
MQEGDFGRGSGRGIWVYMIVRMWCYWIRSGEEIPFDFEFALLFLCCWMYMSVSASPTFEMYHRT